MNCFFLDIRRVFLHENRFISDSGLLFSHLLLLFILDTRLKSNLYEKSKKKCLFFFARKSGVTDDWLHYNNDLTDRFTVCQKIVDVYLYLMMC